MALFAPFEQKYRDERWDEFIDRRACCTTDMLYPARKAYPAHHARPWHTALQGENKQAKALAVTGPHFKVAITFTSR